MATLDASIGEPTPTGAWAVRVDIYRSAVAEIKRAGFFVDGTPEDALYLAQFLAGNEFN